MTSKILFATVVMLVGAGLAILPAIAVPIGMLFLIHVLQTYNKLSDLKQQVLQRRSNVDTELSRRKDLFERLYTVVANSTSAEANLLREIAEIRGNVRAGADRDLARGMSMLTAVAENNPDIKFSQNYIYLQEAISRTESAVQQSRERYNEAVRTYNTMLVIFPNNIAAVPLPFTTANYYEASR